MKYTIFYSWQSDLPNNTNRGFIESVIKKAIEHVNKNEEYELYLTLDRDTQGSPGAPNISQEILKKIQSSDAFVADISIVTGDKEESKRLSPNPNVLLELGYAIAILGWERIVLFFNENYGDGDDLPFDIRQHRRMNYSLAQDGIKSEVRNNLVAAFKSSLHDLIKCGKNTGPEKLPDLEVKWKSPAVNEGSDGFVLTILKMPTSNELKEEMEKAIENVQKIDGRIDRSWGKKVDNYIEKAKQFIAKIDCESSYYNYLATEYKYRPAQVTLLVSNIGIATASDVRIEVTLPDWIFALEKLKSLKDALNKPQMPVPEPPQPASLIQGAALYSGAFNAMLSPQPIADLIDIHSAYNRTSACFLSDKSPKIVFWADKILHKHDVVIDKDVFYLMAKPSAVEGVHSLGIDIFCSEFDDWRTGKLEISVIKP
ncbi:hypothetical protein [Solidesulfovibrio sp. C21]|uniref:hypothetical protein n=1 Tax=Solidesulfovibrio sp. C21 TaxID=3398613 RepID=UPI0039FC05C5